MREFGVCEMFAFSRLLKTAKLLKGNIKLEEKTRVNTRKDFHRWWRMMSLKTERQSGRPLWLACFLCF